MSEKSINDIAAEWVAREECAPLTDAECEERDLWLRADTRHFGAYERAQAVFIHLQRSRAIDGRLHRHTEAPAESDFASFEDEPARGMSRRRLVAGASALALGSVVGGIVLSGKMSPAQAREIRTGKGEIRTETLPDKSTVTLNTSSAIRIRFDDDRRSIDLLEGEASFGVAKDRNRPFIVRVDSFEVQAVGTSFTVNHLPLRRPSVMVQGGIVSVRIPNATPVRAGANTRVAVSDEGTLELEELTGDYLEKSLLWHYGKVSFDETSLADAARIFERYSDRPQLILDPRIADMKITGVFSVTKPEGFANAVAAAFDLKAEYGSDRILLSPRT